jgi:hypothetical protein
MDKIVLQNVAELVIVARMFKSVIINAFMYKQNFEEAVQ